MPLAPLKDPWQQVPIVDNESDEVIIFELTANIFLPEN